MRIFNLLLSGLVGIAFSVLSFPGGQIGAPAQAAELVRIVVMTDDSDPNTLRRKSDVHRRIIAEMRRNLKRQGFELVDEEMIAVTLGFAITERRAKDELIRTVKEANNASNVNVHSRVMVIYRLYAYTEPLNFSQKLILRLDGELYDSHNGTFIDSFEVKGPNPDRPGEFHYTVPAKCNTHCVESKAGGESRKLAAALGEVLGRVLRIHVKKMAGLSAQPEAQPAGVAALGKSYNVILRNFKTAEVLKIVSAMREDYKAFVDLELTQRQPAARHYKYVTNLNASELEQSFLLTLQELGLKLDDDVAFAFKGETFDIEKLKY